MNNEYIIVNKTAIEKRIEELKKELKQFEKYQSISREPILTQIEVLKQLLSQSTPLIPEIENAFYEGKNRMQHEIIEKLGLRYQTQQVSQSTILSMRVDSEDYISNLKLV